MKRVAAQAIMAGMSFSVLGMAYGLGKYAQIRPMDILAVTASVGVVFFLARWTIERRHRPPMAVPLCVWVWGVAGGGSQVLAGWIIGEAMRRGPLSPVWCALSLAFLPVILYSAVRYRERLDGLKALAVVAGAACVVVASFNHRTGADAPTAPAGMLYAAVLAALLAVSSVMNVALKSLAMRIDVDGRTAGLLHRSAFLVTVYAVIAAGAWANVLLTRNVEMPWVRLGGLGLMAAAGSVAGFLFLTACAAAPAAIVFTLYGISGVLSASLFSVLFLGEALNGVWMGTIALGSLSILLGGWSSSRRRAISSSST